MESYVPQNTTAVALSGGCWCDLLQHADSPRAPQERPRDSINDQDSGLDTTQGSLGSRTKGNPIQSRWRKERFAEEEAEHREGGQWETGGAGWYAAAGPVTGKDFPCILKEKTTICAWNKDSSLQAVAQQRLQGCTVASRGQDAPGPSGAGPGAQRFPTQHAESLQTWLLSVATAPAQMPRGGGPGPTSRLKPQVSQARQRQERKGV